MIFKAQELAVLRNKHVDSNEEVNIRTSIKKNNYLNWMNQIKRCN